MPPGSGLPGAWQPHSRNSLGSLISIPSERTPHDCPHALIQCTGLRRPCRDRSEIRADECAASRWDTPLRRRTAARCCRNLSRSPYDDPLAGRLERAPYAALRPRSEGARKMDAVDCSCRGSDDDLRRTWLLGDRWVGREADSRDTEERDRRKGTSEESEGVVPDLFDDGAMAFPRRTCPTWRESRARGGRAGKGGWRVVSGGVKGHEASVVITGGSVAEGPSATSKGHLGGLRVVDVP